MGRVATAVVVASLAALAAGCGTVDNLCPRMWGKREVYGGVGLDAYWFGRYVDGSAFLEDNPPLALRAYTASLVALDLPFSALGDTLTLPLTLAVAISQHSTAALIHDPIPSAEEPALGKNKSNG